MNASACERDPGGREARRWITGLVIFAVALTVRGIYLWCIASSPLFDSPAMDARLHAFWAWSIVESGGLGPEPYFRAPLYPYFLAPFFAASGQSFGAYFAIRAVQFAMGSVTCVLLYDLAQRIYGFRAGVIAGAMGAFYWVFVYFEGELLLPALVTFLTVWGFWFLHRAETRGRVGWYLAAGSAFGLAAITRPNVLVVLPLVIVWSVLLRRREDRGGAARVVAPFALALLVPVGLVTLRNYVVGRDFVVIASQAGVNFYIGNNEFSDGRTAVVPGTRATWIGGYEDTIRIAEQAAGRRLRPSEVSRYWFRKGFGFLAAHPGRAVELYWRKLRLLFDVVEPSNNQNIYFFRNYSGFLALPIFVGFWLVVPLGLLGAWRGRRDRWGLLFLGFVALYLGSFLPFFVTARFRVPALPFLMILAAAGLDELWTLWRARRAGPLARRGLAVLVIGVLLFVNRGSVDGARAGEPSDGHFSLGNAWLRKTELDAALEHYRLSARYHEPYGSRSHMQIGAILLLRGDVDGAFVELREALRMRPLLEKEIAAICRERGHAELLAKLGADRRK